MIVIDKLNSCLILAEKLIVLLLYTIVVITTQWFDGTLRYVAV